MRMEQVRETRLKAMRDQKRDEQRDAHLLAYLAGDEAQMGYTIHNKELGAEVEVCSAMVDKASNAAALGGVNAVPTDRTPEGQKER